MLPLLRSDFARRQLHCARLHHIGASDIFTHDKSPHNQGSLEDLPKASLKVVGTAGGKVRICMLLFAVIEDEECNSAIIRAPALFAPGLQSVNQVLVINVLSSCDSCKVSYGRSCAYRK